MGEGAFASDRKEQLKTSAGRFWSDDKWGKSGTPTQRQGRRGISPKLLLRQTFEGKTASLGGPVQHVTRLRVATLVRKPCARHYNSPRWWFEAHHTIKRSHCGSCFLEARRLRMSTMLSQQFLSLGGNLPNSPNELQL